MFQNWLKEKGIVWPESPRKQEDLVSWFHREILEKGERGEL